VTGAIDADQALLVLKIGFLILLYVFIWAVVRSATRDLRVAPQESIVLSAQDAQALRAQVDAPAVRKARLLVLESTTLPVGSVLEVGAPTRVGRSTDNGVQLEGDDFVSSRHAVLEPRPDGLWVEDAGSTNGTFVNGARVTTARLLRTGDVIRIGQTDMRVEA
jgi:hypothetical protein